MFSNLLPGLREVRAPLAAGYLWLLVGWLLVHPIDAERDAPGAVDAVRQLSDELGPVALSAAVTFLAYLVGALWEPIAEWLAADIWALRSVRASAHTALARRRDPRTDPFVGRMLEARSSAGRSFEFREELIAASSAAGRNPLVPPRSKRLSHTAWRRLWVIAPRLFAEIDESVRQRVGVTTEEQMRCTEKLGHGLRAAWEFTAATWGRPLSEVELEAHRALMQFDEMSIGTDRDEWWVREADDLIPSLDIEQLGVRNGVAFWGIDRPFQEPLVGLKRSEERTARYLDQPDLVAHLFDELPLSAHRLVGEEEKLFLESSRMKGEVEFRVALAIPVAVAASVLSFGLGLSPEAWLGCTILGAAAGWALLLDAWRRDRERNDFLVELLAVGRAKSPTFERLRERAAVIEGVSPAAGAHGRPSRASASGVSR